MRRGFVFTALAAAALAAVPGESEAFGRRGRPTRCQSVYPAPVVYYPAPCYTPAPFGFPAPSPGAVSAPKEVTIKGKRYQIIPDPDKGDYPEDVVDKEAEDLPSAAGASIPAADKFTGTSRRIAKTTIFKAPVEEFDALAALLDSLPTNDVMRGKNISHAPTSNRVAEERRNVRVKAFLYAFKKEPDRDYHLILGGAPGTPNQRYLNAEVSGIPIAGTDENRAQLLAVRNDFKSAFDLGPGGPGSYFRPNPPVPVRVTGSLLWDVDHENPPFVGPQSHKPRTAWEIHPISVIEFLED
jgi:hypothetical protein